MNLKLKQKIRSLFDGEFKINFDIKNTGLFKMNRKWRSCHLIF